jgi:exosortase D (VPLPA-CTERM-specific)
MRSIVSNGAPASAPHGRDALLWAGIGVVLVLCLGYLFAAGLAGIAARWQEPEYSHGYMIPLVTLLVLWQRWPSVRAAATPGSWLGVALTAAGLALLLAGRLAMSDIPQGIAFVATLAGLGLAALGSRGMRYLWAPLAFLLFALPIPAPAYIKLATQLQLISSQWGAALLDLLGISFFLDGNIIDLGVYKLQVAEACSGLRYLFPLVSFGFLCAWLYRAPLWARATVLLSTVLITVVINSLRIALTGVLIEYGGVALAEGFLHLFEGWVIFLVALALLFAEMWLLARLWTRKARLADLLDFERIAGPRPLFGTAERTDWGRPSVPLVACLGLLIAALPAQAQLADRHETIPARPGLVTFPLHLDDWRGRPLPVDQAILESLNADDYFLADYGAQDVPTTVNLWIAYYASQTEGHWIHSPKECLPGGGWEFVSIDPVDAPVPHAQAAGFTLNRAVIANGTRRMLMYYWYEQRGRQIANETMTRFYILADSFTLRRSDGALIRLMTPILPGEEIAAAEARLIGLFRGAYPHLEPHVGL